MVGRAAGAFGQRPQHGRGHQPALDDDAVDGGFMSRECCSAAVERPGRLRQAAGVERGRMIEAIRIERVDGRVGASGSAEDA